MNEITPPEIRTRQISRYRFLHHWWFWVLLIAVAGAGVYFYLKPSSHAAPAEGGGRHGGRRGTMPVVVGVTAKTGDINVYLNGLGAVTPLGTVTVRARVDGELMKILVSEGQTVKRGEPIAEIDPRPSQVLLEQAEGQMAHDQALLKNAQLDLQRYRTLFKQDSIAEQQLATQDALVRQYEGQIKIDKGQIDSAKLQLSYCHITSPINGRIGLRQVDPGNIVHASDANGIVVITQLQPITVVFSIPEDNIPAVMQKLQSGKKMGVDAYDRAQKNKLSSGTLLTVDNQIDPATGTVKLKAQFANDNYALFPNQFVNAQLLVDTKRNVILIPSAGVQRGSQGTYVYIINADKTVTLRLVTVGITDGDNTQIEKGVAAGEAVVVEGADKLRDAAKVEISMKDGKAPQGKNAAGAADANAAAVPGSARRHHRKGSTDGKSAAGSGA